MSLKVLNSQKDINTGNPEKLIDAIHYAEKMGAKICNLSLSFTTYYEEVENVMKNSDMLFVVTAGNGNGRGINIDKKPSYPASLGIDNMIVVSNLNYNGEISKASNYGKESVDLAAPGTCIYTTTVNNQYRFGSGTSMSAAVVSGIAAVVYSIKENMTAYEAKDLICSNVRKTEELKNKVSSGGFVDGYETLRKLCE